MTTLILHESPEGSEVIDFDTPEGRTYWFEHIGDHAFGVNLINELYESGIGVIVVPYTDSDLVDTYTLLEGGPS